MRKRWFTLLAVMIALSTLAALISGCGRIRVIIDGQEKVLSPAPVLVDSSVMVPARGIFEALGASVTWDGGTGAVTAVKGSRTMRIVPNSRFGMVDGLAKVLSTPSQLVESTTYVPLSFVGEALGANVQYAKRVIEISWPVPVDNNWEIAQIHFIDVGQGNSVLIQSAGKSVLIDGGDADKGDAVLAYLRSCGVTSLDLVISTSPNAEHIGGLPAVIDALPVARVIDSGVAHSSEVYAKYLSLINEKGVPLETPSSQSILFRDSVRLDIIGPVKEYADPSNSSIVTRFVAGELSVLLASDMAQEAEADLLAAFDLRSTVLMAAKHGSEASTSVALLAEVIPQDVVISAGAEFPHPTPDEPGWLSGRYIYSTDFFGNIKFRAGKVFHMIETDNHYEPYEPWGEESETVFVTETGTDYHLEGCPRLDGSQVPIDLNDAVNAGFEPCEICDAPLW